MAKKATDTDIFTLHRYFLWATHMANHLRIVIEQQGPFPTNPKDLQHWLREPFMYLSYWFASLYVVIEAWRDLKLNDPKVDALVSSPYTDLLRRYRNGIFHYQRKYFDEQFLFLLFALVFSIQRIQDLGC